MRPMFFAIGTVGQGVSAGIDAVGVVMLGVRKYDVAGARETELVMSDGHCCELVGVEVGDDWSVGNSGGGGEGEETAVSGSAVSTGARPAVIPLVEGLSIGMSVTVSCRRSTARTAAKRRRKNGILLISKLEATRTKCR